MKAQRGASEVGGRLEDSLGNSSSSLSSPSLLLPPTSGQCRFSLRSSRSPLLERAAFTPWPLLSSSHHAAGPTRSVLSRPSLPLSLSKLSFPAFYRSCNPTPRSFSLSVRYRYWQRPHPCVPRQPMTKQNHHPLYRHTHTQTQPCTHACCRSRSR